MDQILIEEPKEERKIISIDEGQVRDHLDKRVLSSVEGKQPVNYLVAEGGSMC